MKTPKNILLEKGEQIKAGADLRGFTGDELFALEEIAIDNNDLNLLHSLMPFTDSFCDCDECKEVA